MCALPYERELDVARRAAEEAGARIAAYVGHERPSWDKSEGHPVTQADLEANQVITGWIGRAFPDDAIRSEESAFTGSRSSERVWLIDPLDGTKEFIAGVPEFAVSIALTLRGEPIAGVVFPPLTRECFWASQRGGAWLDDCRLEISRCSELSKAVLITSRSEMDRGQLEPYRDWFARLEPIGSVALKLAWIAAARGDAWLSLAPKNEWDVCAGDLLVREAGGVMTPLRSGVRRYNEENPLIAPPLAAGPPALVAALRERCST
jgi:myo-inositol-1(or 4)-monophosphatase